MAGYPYRARLAALVAALALLATAPPVSAERLRVRIGTDSAFSECYCRADGRRFAAGERTCLRAGGAPRLASCQMDQNVTSWRLTGEPCPES